MLIINIKMVKIKGRETGNIFDRRDNYAKTIPAFTIETEESLGTSMGMIGSYIQYITILSYFVLKMIYLNKRHDLIVTNTLESDVFDPLEVLQL
jgi:hypothetical protein